VFVLVEQRSLKPLMLPIQMLGQSVSVTAHGAGDASPMPVSRLANGEAMRPLSPAQLSAKLNADGSLDVQWIRRSRLAFGWRDEVEAPVDGEVQGYRVSIAGAAGAIERDTDGSNLSVGAAEIAALGTGPFIISVRQIGALALSRPATITINP